MQLIKQKLLHLGMIIQEFNMNIKERLNEATPLYTEKQKEFITKSRDYRKKQYDNLVEQLEIKFNSKNS